MITFTCTNLLNVETYYNNIEYEALRILHGLDKFHHDLLTWEVHVITYHKPLVTIFKKDVTTSSQ